MKPKSAFRMIMVWQREFKFSIIFEEYSEFIVPINPAIYQCCIMTLSFPHIRITYLTLSIIIKPNQSCSLAVASDLEDVSFPVVTSHNLLFKDFRQQVLSVEVVFSTSLGE